MNRIQSESGFSLPELLIATTLLLVVSSIVTNGLMQITNSQRTIYNRTEMHSGVRGATELLQQEVGQAGRITLPAPVWIASNAVTTVPANPTACVNATTTLNSVAGMWHDVATNTGIILTFLGLDPLTGSDGTEIVKVDAIAGNAVTGCFWHNHPAGAQGVGAPVIVSGAFANGIIPATGGVGSTANKLKLFGETNADGQIEYVEYYCDNGDPGTAGSHNLYRTVVTNLFAAVAPTKPAVDDSMILLSNVHSNPVDAGGAARPCFQYQTTSLTVQGTPVTFVLDVAVTLTVWTQQTDAITKQYQTETKALLNVSPRNVFAAWEMASLGYTDRIQPTPGIVTALLP